MKILFLFVFSGFPHKGFCFCFPCCFCRFQVPWTHLPFSFGNLTPRGWQTLVELEKVFSPWFYTIHSDQGPNSTRGLCPKPCTTFHWHTPFGFSPKSKLITGPSGRGDSGHPCGLLPGCWAGQSRSDKSKNSSRGLSLILRQNQWDLWWD